MIHLEGLGVIGSYLAHRLWLDGIPFTWNDTDGQINAWRACTGAIFPTGHAEDLEAMAVWARHLTEPGFAGHMERAAYVYSQEHPPHGGKYAAELLVGNMKVAAVASLHLNAQTFVPATRALFAPARRDSCPAGSTRVITHGFGPRLARFMWGWYVPVDVRVAVRAGDERPAIYCREGRFVMTYAYPIPGTAVWYAGSSLISQRVPKRLDIGSKFRRWREQFLRMTEGYVLSVGVTGVAVHGWRPVPASGDDAWVTRQADGSFAARPLWHSGVRHAPHIYTALREALDD